MKKFLKRISRFAWVFSSISVNLLHWYVTPGRGSFQILGIAVAGTKIWHLFETEWSAVTKGIGISGFAIYRCIAFFGDPGPTWHLTAFHHTKLMASSVDPIDRILQKYSMSEIKEGLGPGGIIWLAFPVINDLPRKACDICVRELVFSMATAPRP